MSETKTDVKIPVGWLRLDRGVITLPGDWFWNNSHKEWQIVRVSRLIIANRIVIQRCRYTVGETVYVWKSSGFDPELDLGTAIIERVFASDHRGVQQVALKKTGNPAIYSILTTCASDILAPVFPIVSGLGYVPQEWNERDVAQFGNDPNEATQTETVVDEALNQAELTEAPQPVEPSGNPGQLEEVSIIKQSSTTAEAPQLELQYRDAHAGDVGKRVEVRDSTDPTSDDARWVERTLAAVLAPRRIDGDVEFATCVEGYDIKHICHTWKFARIKIEEPAKEPVSIVCDHQVCELAGPTGVCCPPDSCDIDDGVRKLPPTDHIADANKMVGNPSETPNGSAPGPKPKTLYIAGPMRGIAYFNYPMFDRIAGLLRDQGLHVISPADEDRKQDGFDPFENPDHAVPENCTFPRTMDFHKIVRRCLDAVLQCEEIVLLPGWERSSGAVAELTLAMWLNKRVRHVRIDKDNQVSFACFWKGLESLAVDLYDEYLPKADEPGDSFAIDDDESSDDILEEALNITRGSRNASYGPPDQDFRRTAGMWSALFSAKLREGETFEPRDVALAMILLKTSRETHQRKRDNWVDIAGYARCGSLCN